MSFSGIQQLRSVMSIAMRHEPLEAPLPQLTRRWRASLRHGSEGTKTCIQRSAAPPTIPRTPMTITTPVIQATRTHDLQSDESDAQRLPRLQPPVAGRPQSATSDSLALSLRCRPPHLRLTTRSPGLMTDVCRPSSVITTTMPRELLGARLRQQRRYQLLSIGSGPSKASLNAPRSGMM
jgi:hypothetical protein